METEFFTAWRLCWRLVKRTATIPMSAANRINNSFVRDQSLPFLEHIAKGHIGSYFDLFFKDGACVAKLAQNGLGLDSV